MASFRSRYVEINSSITLRVYTFEWELLIRECWTWKGFETYVNHKTTQLVMICLPHMQTVKSYTHAVMSNYG